VVSFIDFGPSVLSLAGIEADERLDGIPFLGAHARPGRGYAFAHADRFDAVYDRARSVSDGRFRYVRNLITDEGHLIPNAYRDNLAMMRDLNRLQETGPQRPEQWQVASRGRPPEELYDSRNDPWEISNLIDNPEHRDVLARLRQALDDWIEETGDLGLVLPEKRMVEEHLWRGGQKPATAVPEMSWDQGQITLRCDTAGASIGYRISQDHAWTVYAGAFSVPDALGLEVVAHRIGYLPARKSFSLR
jgi:hypothetical protein